VRTPSDQKDGFMRSLKKFWFLLLSAAALLAVSGSALAKLKVVVTTPDIAAVARAVAGDRAEVTPLALPTQDPHWVDARPHLALTLSRADLLLVTGAELEIGWLPTLLSGSRNGAIQRGSRGYLDCAELVPLLEVPQGKVDRSQGDIHPTGNPHYMLDPRAVERVAVGIGKRMAELDPSGKQNYLENTKRFLSALRAARARWEKTLAASRGQKVIAYHKSMNYLADWIGLVLVAHVEPRPGIPPNPRHVANLIELARREKVRVVLQESWYPDATSKILAEKCGARLTAISTMPDFAKGESYIAHMNDLVEKLRAGFGG
jgi:zinc/manganese transport system substrate-binding protein